MSRPLVVRALGDLSDLERALTRSGIVAEDASKKIQGSFRAAGLAAADEAKKIGLGVDEQAAAAGRAAAAFTEMSAKITTAQRNAGKAAATAAGAVGASVDEQRAAYAKAIAVQAEYEAAVGRAAGAAKAAAAEQAAAAEAAAAKITAASAKQAAAVESAQKKMASLGKWTLAGGIGIAAVSVKGAVDLQRSMEQIHTQAGASQAEVNKLTKAVMDMAPALATGPNALAGSLYDAESAGLRGAKALGVMSAAAKEARISGANLSDTTTTLSAAVYSGIGGAQNFTNAMGLLNATVGAGTMRFQDLNEAFAGPMLGVVKGYGLSLKDVGAALADFGDLNIKGADAATQLRMAVQYMAKPAASAGPLLEKLGLNTHSFANAMANGGLMPALQLLHDRLDKVGVKGNQMAQVIGDLFTKKGASGIDLLLNSYGRLESKYKQVGDGASKQNQAWIDWNKTLAADVDHLRATVAALADKFGTYLIPKLTAAGNAIKDVIAWMGKHKAAAQDLATVIGSVLGLAITVFAYTKAVAFIGATGDMIGALGKLGGGIASAASTIAAKTGLMSASTTGAAAVMETQNAAAGASFTAIGAEAGAGVAAVETEVGSMAGAVTAADTEIEAANVAAGLSFTAMLGPIAAVGAAILVTQNGLHRAMTDSQRYQLDLKFAEGNGMSPKQAAAFLAKSGITPGNASGGASALAGIPSASQVNAATGVGYPTLNTGGNTLQGSPSWGGGPVPVPATGSNAQRIAGALARQGFSKVAIAGILGNFAQETGGGNVNAINTADSGTGASGVGGMGIANWTAGRRTAEMAYATAHHESATSLAAQVGYLVQELRTSKHSAYKAISGASTPQQAAQLFNQLFEGGTDPNGIREKAAAQAMQMLGSGGGLSNAALNALLDSGKGGSAKKATYGIPQAVENMLHLAQQLEGAPYSQANHAGAYNETIAQIKKFGTDCSGLVSVLLKEGVTGIRAAQNTEGLPTNAGLSKGTGRYVTVYDRPGPITPNSHALIDILGHYFESGGSSKYNPSGGVTQLTAKQAAGELSGGGFVAYHPTNLNSPVKGGSLAGVPGNNMPNLIAQIAAAFTKALTTAAGNLLQKYNNVIQSGTLRSLSSALGENSSHVVSPNGAISGQMGLTTPTTKPGTVNSLLHQRFEQLGLSTNMRLINGVSGGIVAAGAAGSTQEKAYQTTVANLIANGQKKLAEQLVAAHKQAMQALGQEMYAQQALKDAESLNLQSTNLKDQTTAITDAAQGQLDVVKAGFQLMNDKAQAQAQFTQNMTQTITDQWSGMVQSVEDHTQMMSDSANAVVQGINDQTQIQVDVLGEKGLFGLHLIAQKLQVGLDIQKAADDRAIAAAQLNLDQVTLDQHSQVQRAQLHLDQLTTIDQMKAAQAQQRSDTIQITQTQRLASAQAKVDANVLHNDVSVIGPAQMAVDLNANLPQSQRNVFDDILKKATGQANVSELGDQPGGLQWFTRISNSVNAITAGAVQDAQNVTAWATQDIANAGQTLADVTGNANYLIGLAQQNLSGVQGGAAITEAGLQSGVSTTQAQASTQFAGSGAVINIYGVPVENAGAIGSAASWALRTATA